MFRYELLKFRLIHLDRVGKQLRRIKDHHVGTGDRDKAWQATRRADLVESAIRFKIEHAVPGDTSLLRLEAELGLLPE